MLLLDLVCYFCCNSILELFKESNTQNFFMAYLKYEKSDSHI